MSDPAAPPRARPTLAVDVSTEGVRIAVARDVVRQASLSVLRAERVPQAMLSITFVTPRRMAALNREHLGHRGATDVISFHFDRPSPDAPLLGDIYICPDVARQHARANGVGVREELLRLAVHGTLHVIGWEHPEGDGRLESRMWKRQEALLARALAARDR
ncbi:MAG: hypothetical protein JWO05_3191 [Gemmatimonadetes bacterium]|nr:hypothetical protein [Gemmatimonadota bacterium]